MDTNQISERDIENLLEQQLSKNGWVIDFQSQNRNVYFQQARTQEENDHLSGLKPDFCLYLTHQSSFPEIIIETKKPNMNLAKTKIQALKYAKLLETKIIILFDGIQIKNYWVENEEELLHNDLVVDSIKNSSFYQKFILLNSNHYQESSIVISSREELIHVFAFTNQKLRKAGITKGIERFFEFSNLLFLKLVSEENDVLSEKIPDHIKWGSYQNKSGHELLSYINEIVIPNLEKIFNKQGKDTLFTQLMIQDTLALKQIVEKLDCLNLSGIQTDIKGDAFEYFIQQYNNSNNDLGEYFTPRHIVNFLVQLANPQYNEKIYDPFCGTGGILISTFNYIQDSLKKNNILNQVVLKDLKEHTIFGSEISSNARIARMNMILTGDGHSNIKQQDTLLNPIEEQFDIVITNIPFNLEGTASHLYSLFNKNGNSQSLQHIVNSLKKQPNARAYVIVPESILNNLELKKIRKYLIENHLLKQIISLPSGVFLPYTEAKASILILQGFNNKKIDTIKYTKIKNDGFTLTQRRRKILKQVNDIEEYLFDHTYCTDELKTKDILNHQNYSLIWFKYSYQIPKNYVLLKEILEEEKIKNIDLHKTATITKHEFYGIIHGEEYWKESFVSVTSETTEGYKVVNQKSIAYNPSRANTGSLGINLTGSQVAVSPMYVTFRIKSEEFLPEYIFFFLRSQEGIQSIKERSFGSVRQALRFEDLCTIAIPQISIDDQLVIVEKAKRKYQNYIQAKKELSSFGI